VFVTTHSVRIITAAATAAAVLGGVPAAAARPAGVPRNQVSSLIAPEPGAGTQITTPDPSGCGAGRFLVCARTPGASAVVPSAALRAMESELRSPIPAAYSVPHAAMRALEAETGR
jgi:hypothetical protein